MDYLIKASVLLSIWYLFFLIFLRKETFFTAIRWFFLTGIFLAFLLPKIMIPVYVTQEYKQNLSEKIVEDISLEKTDSPPLTTAVTTTSLTPLQVFTLLYFVGFTFFLLKFLVEFISLFRLIQKSDKRKEKGIILVELPYSLAPFSVGHYLIYSKKNFSSDEIQKIIAHERIHIKQHHTFDVFIANMTTILLWFLPFAWFYKKKLQENLEFIADKYAVNQFNKKDYQYLLLKASTTKYPFALGNNFYQSFIKKRIIMLHTSHSKTINLVKFVIILPFIALFLFSFNTKKVYVISNNLNDTIHFTNPVAVANVTGISGFGYRINPVLKKRSFHKGIDIMAYKDMDVYATADGKVIDLGFDTDNGNFIVLKHDNNYQTKYYHLGLVEVAKNEKVKSGEIIGTIGNTGKSTGYHLHYEILNNGKNVNPIAYVNYDTPQNAQNTTNTKSKNIGFSGINIVINKNTTDKELKKIENEFSSKNHIVFKIVSFKRNSKNEIITLELNAKTKKNTVSFNYDANIPIPSILLLYDKTRDEVQFLKIKVVNTDKKNSGFISIENDVINGSIRYKDATYFYHKTKNNIQFYDKFGDEVNAELTKSLKIVFKKTNNSNY